MAIKYLQLYRVAILCNHIVAFIVSDNLDVTKVQDQRAYDLKLFSKRFFTGWNVAFQIMFLIVALINTTIQQKSFKFVSPRTKQFTNRLQGFIFNCLVAPSTIFVASMFWTLWTIDRELVLSEVLDAIVPSWLNHALHTVIIIPVVVELLFCKMQLPHHKDAVTVLAVVHLIYTAVLMGTYFEYGRWIYYVFEVLEWPEKFALCFLSFALSVVGYYIGYKFQQIRWHSNIVQQIKLHTKSLESMINF